MPILKPKDIVALLSIISIFLMILIKSNHSLDTTLALILGYYFAKRSSGIDKGY